MRDPNRLYMIDYINYTPRTLDEILKANKGENANEG